MLSKYLTCFLFALVLVILFNSFSVAEQITEEWIITTVPEGLVGSRAAVSPGGDLYVANSILDSVTGYDWIVTKFGSLGETLWTNAFRDTGYTHESPYFVALDQFGNLYVVGYWNSDSTDDCLAIKYSPTGSIIWTASFLYYYLNDIAVDNYGNLYVTGFNGYDGADKENFILTKLSASGEVLWTSVFDSPEHVQDIPYSIAADDSGNVYVAGYTCGPPDIYYYDYLTVKYSTEGNLLWSARYSSGTWRCDLAYDIVPDNQGNCYVTGSIGDQYSLSSDAYLNIKYGPTGETLWTRKLTGEYGGPYLTDLQRSFTKVDDDGNIVVVGTTWGYLGSDYTLVKYSPNGDTMWHRIFKEDSLISDDEVTSIAIDVFNNIYITGRSWEYYNPQGLEDFLTVKYSSTGETNWAVRYNNPGDLSDRARFVGIDSLGNTYVVGSSGPFNTYLKYKHVNSDTLQAAIKPIAWSLSQNYPNPFNPSTTIRFSLLSSSYVTLEVFNILGQKVRTLVNEDLTAGYKQINWDGTNQNGQPVSSGIYFYRLKTDSFSETKKMVLMK